MADKKVEKKQKSFSDVVKNKKAAEKVEKRKPAPVEEPETEVTEEEAAAEDTETETSAVEVSAEETEEEAEAATAAAEPKKELSEVEQLRSELRSMAETHQKQIDSLVGALQHDRNVMGTGAELADDASDLGEPMHPQMVANPYVDKLFEDGVRSRYNDYEEVVNDFREHAKAKNSPQIVQQILALTPDQRYEQLYQAGLAVRYFKNYGTLHLPDLEKKFLDKGKEQATAEFNKLTQAQKAKAIAAKGKQATDTTAAKSSGNDSSIDEYQSPKRFRQVLKGIGAI